MVFEKFGGWRGTLDLKNGSLAQAFNTNLGNFVS